jgi:hypothetical protein
MGGGVKESMTAMARVNPTSLDLVDLISVPFNFLRGAAGLRARLVLISHTEDSQIRTLTLRST